MIKEEFEKFHQFLLEEEKTRLKMLKKEEEIKTQVMCEKLELIKSQVKSLSSLIGDMERMLIVRDLPFLQVHLQPWLTQNHTDVLKPWWKE